MSDKIAILKEMYNSFNARDINGVLKQLTDEVLWANGMEGGHVHCGQAVREYWTRQWAMVSPHVEPLHFHPRTNDAVLVEVRQTVYDLDGQPLAEASGLKNKTVGHLFHFQGDKVARLDIEEIAGA